MASRPAILAGRRAIARPTWPPAMPVTAVRPFVALAPRSSCLAILVDLVIRVVRVVSPAPASPALLDHFLGLPFVLRLRPARPDRSDPACRYRASWRIVRSFDRPSLVVP